MLTEPLTTPPTRRWRLIYGAIVGALFSPFIAIGAITSSPELALLVGNIFSYIVSPKGKRTLTLVDKERVSGDIYHFTFAPDKKSFVPARDNIWNGRSATKKWMGVATAATLRSHHRPRKTRSSSA